MSACRLGIEQVYPADQDQDCAGNAHRPTYLSNCQILNKGGLAKCNDFFVFDLEWDII